MLKLVKAALLALAGLGMASALAQSPTLPVGTAASVDWWAAKQVLNVVNTAEVQTGSSFIDKRVTLSALAQSGIPGQTKTLPISAKLALSGKAVAKGLVKSVPYVTTAFTVGAALYDIWGDFDLQFQDGQVVQPGATGGTTVPKITTGHLHTCVAGSTGPRGSVFSCSDLGFSSFEASTPYQSAAQSAWLAKIAGVGQAICNAHAQRDNYNHSYTYKGGSYSSYQGSWYGIVPCMLNGYTSVDQITFVFQYSPPASTCPANSTDNGTNCTCDSGYADNGSGLCMPSFKTLSQSELETIVSDLLANEGWPTNLAPALKQALPLPGVPDAILDPADDPRTVVKIAPSPELELDTATVGDPVVRTRDETLPDGSTKNITTSTATTATAAGDRITFSQDATTTETLFDPTGAVVSTTTATTTVGTDPSGQAADAELKVCGLPGGPACLIDETGTPEQVEDDSTSKIDEIFQPLMECMTDPLSCLPELPEVNWAFTFPSSCGSISMGGYSQIGLPSIDVCQYQGIIHDLMSMLWAAAGLFGAVGMISGANRQEG